MPAGCVEVGAGPGICEPRQRLPCSAGAFREIESRQGQVRQNTRLGAGPRALRGSCEHRPGRRIPRSRRFLPQPVRNEDLMRCFRRQQLDPVEVGDGALRLRLPGSERLRPLQVRRSQRGQRLQRGSVGLPVRGFLPGSQGRAHAVHLRSHGLGRPRGLPPRRLRPVRPRAEGVHRRGAPRRRRRRHRGPGRTQARPAVRGDGGLHRRLDHGRPPGDGAGRRAPLLRGAPPRGVRLAPGGAAEHGVREAPRRQGVERRGGRRARVGRRRPARPGAPRRSLQVLGLPGLLAPGGEDHPRRGWRTFWHGPQRGHHRRHRGRLGGGSASILFYFGRPVGQREHARQGPAPGAAPEGVRG
mmetsp:Transcript_28703/g.82115  ORF Transcript_28703/g.82115 Transcript_28703/m.82115 type:complete len:356 (-) Transcript_28703:165-1232(-)